MLGTDHLVQVHRASPEDADAIAELHDAATRTAIRIARGHADGVHTVSDSAAASTWRKNLALTSGDHRPWIATSRDRTVGFVSGGPSHDDDASPLTGELYVSDFDFELGDGAGARALINHECADLRKLGLSEVTIWVVARDMAMRTLLEGDGWRCDRARRWHRMYGVPVLEFRYRSSL